MKCPTFRQLEILAFVADGIRANGKSPAHLEIVAHFGFASAGAAVTDHLRALERKGLIRVERRKHHTIVITDSGHAALPRRQTVLWPVRCLHCARTFFRGTEANHVCAAEDLAVAS